MLHFIDDDEPGLLRQNLFAENPWAHAQLRTQRRVQQVVESRVRIMIVEERRFPGLPCTPQKDGGRPGYGIWHPR